VQPLNRILFQADPRGVCPRLGPDLRLTRNVTFNISAVLANDVLPAVPGVTVIPTGEQVLSAATPGNPVFPATGIATLHAGGPLPGVGTLVYNARTSTVKGTAQHIAVNETGPLHDPTAILYVRNGDLGADGKLRAGVPVEPLVLRVNAGDCVTINLTNRLPANRLAPDLPNYNDMRHANKRERLHPEGSTVFGVNHVRPSSSVGFHTQLMEYDVTRSDGTNVGINPVQTAAPGQTKTYVFYAGDLRLAEAPQIGDPTRSAGRMLAPPNSTGKDSTTSRLNRVGSPICGASARRRSPA
jgi:manganese oxidase